MSVAKGILRDLDDLEIEAVSGGINGSNKEKEDQLNYPRISTTLGMGAAAATAMSVWTCSPAAIAVTGGSACAASVSTAAALGLAGAFAAFAGY